MQISRISIENFRGIKTTEILLPKHAVLIGDNNTGKTTILEAIDLTLGPDRLNRFPVIDEHDFYQGRYVVIPEDGNKPEIQKIAITVTIINLSEEQIARFGNYIEFWDTTTNHLYDKASPDGVDADYITEAIRVTFIGNYIIDDDDFEGKTYYSRSLEEGETPQPFNKKDKQLCGFLYLRTLRTGSRALSLERGSLLDIIMRLKEIRPKMWESTLKKISSYSVARDPDFGISEVLESINSALKKYVPKEWGIEPHLKISNLTREHLRKVITPFIATGVDTTHAAPFYRQGTGTINMLVLAMLSQIAADKQNVIFAMEEPEIAVPPYAQKRIIHEIRKLSTQALFTSHSPYVLEEFSTDETIVLSRNDAGKLKQHPISLPSSVKPKRYRQEFRTRFCEGLLSRRILIAEGATEAASLPAVSRRLAEENNETYMSLEAMGICTIDAGSENNIPDLAKLYKELGKTVFAICDKQTEANQALIEAQVDVLYMHEEKGFEDLVLSSTSEEALKRYCRNVDDWPEKILHKYPRPEDAPKEALLPYFKKTKGEGTVSDLLVQCYESEIPEWLKKTCISLKFNCESKQPIPEETENIEATDAPPEE